MVAAMLGKVEVSQGVTENFSRTGQNRKSRPNVTELGFAGGHSGWRHKLHVDFERLQKAVTGSSLGRTASPKAYIGDERIPSTRIAAVERL